MHVASDHKIIVKITRQTSGQTVWCCRNCGANFGRFGDPPAPPGLAGFILLNLDEALKKSKRSKRSLRSKEFDRGRRSNTSEQSLVLNPALLFWKASSLLLGIDRLLSIYRAGCWWCSVFHCLCGFQIYPTVDFYILQWVIIRRLSTSTILQTIQTSIQIKRRTFGI